MDAKLLERVCRATGARAVARSAEIQSLWGGYGQLSRVRLTGARHETAIVKSVVPPASAGRARGDRSHRRKCRSYDVEVAWYRKYAATCDAECRVAELFDADAADGRWLLVLEDLDAAGFSARRPGTRPSEMGACLRWLAAFHARFLGAKPDGLWPEGTYWHLATRPDELVATEDAELRAAAPELNRRLREARHRTFVHGDPKAENFCFRPDGGAVAAVDFQYVGGGCGMRDVAYFLHGSVRAGEVGRQLDVYFGHLGAALSARGVDSGPVEAEWRALYPIAAADFWRFLAGWARGSWERDRESRALTLAVIRALG